jgi:hypothetical protein
VNAEDPVVASFLKRLDAGEVDRRLNLELSRLSCSQLLTISRILAERSAKKAANQR